MVEDKRTYNMYQYLRYTNLMLIVEQIYLRFYHSNFPLIASFNRILLSYILQSISIPGVCVLGEKLFAVGGYDGSGYLSLVEAYDSRWEPELVHGGVKILRR